MNTDDEVEIAEDNLFKWYCELTISRKSQDKNTHTHTYIYVYNIHIN